MDFRPKKRNINVGLYRFSVCGRPSLNLYTDEDFIRPSTMDADRPAGLNAGARAIKTLIFWLSCG